MLTDAQMQQMYEEDKLLARGLDPDYTPLHEEADSFQYSQETDLPQAKPGHGGGGTDDVKWYQDVGNNIGNYVSSKLNQPASVEDLRRYEALLDQEGGDLNRCFEPQIDLSEEGFKGWVKDTEQLAKGIADSMDSFKASRLYANLFYGKDALQDRIHKISKATGIGESVLASDDDVYQHGEKLLQQLEKYEKIPSMLTTDGKLDMQKVYQEMPYLKILQEKHGDVTAAMALANARGLMTINDVYKNELERFAASVGYGLDKGRNNLMRQYTYGKAMLRGLAGKDGRLTAEEKEYVDHLNKENAERPDYSYSSAGSGLGAMIGGALENIPMILSSQGIGKAAGFAAGFAAKRLGASNAMVYKVYNWVSNAVGVGVMGLEIGGGQYEENLYKLDKNGNLMYTPRQAAAISSALKRCAGTSKKTVTWKPFSIVSMLLSRSMSSWVEFKGYIFIYSWFFMQK